MYILTQKGKGIVTNFSDIWAESGRVNYVNAYINYDTEPFITLGSYSSFERCKEVVMEIFKAIRRNQKTFEMPDD